MNSRDPDRLIRFAETFGRLTKGSRSGQPLVLRPFQRQLLADLCTSGARTGYIQIARKNGKSTLGSVLALHGLCGDGEEGSEVYSVAGSRDQARIVFLEAARMVELGPLARSLRVYRHEIVHRKTGSRYKALAAEAGLHEGLNPHLVIFDEVHVLGSRRDLWDVMALGMGTRENPLMLGITTPGVRYGADGRDSLAFTLYEYARRVASGEVTDPTFFARVWEPTRDCATTDRAAWRAANPGLGAFLHVADMEAAQRTTPENEFRTKRLGQWVAQQAAWLPEGAFQGCPDSGRLEPGTPVVLGFDGSRSRDSTALVAASVEQTPQLWTLEAWERPATARHDWQVPRAAVAAAVMAAAERYDVRELAADEALWVSELQDWYALGVPVVGFPQTPSRMIPATQRVYELVTSGQLRHDHDPRLVRHFGNCMVKPSGQLAKDHKDSRRKIDIAVAAVMAVDRAAHLARVPARPTFAVV